MAEENGFEGTREEMERAIRRLNALEYAILVAAVLLALAGGALLALLLGRAGTASFRLLWAVSSLLLILIPGAIVFGRDRLRGRSASERRDPTRRNDG